MTTKKPVRITKAHKLCFLIELYGSMTRVEAMRALHAHEGKKPSSFDPNTNHEYFSPKKRYDGWMSPAARGLIKVAGKSSTGAYIFRVTAAGKKLGRAYDRFLTKQQKPHSDIARG